MSRFENMHPIALAELARKYKIKCDIWLLDTVDAYYDIDGFERAKAAAKAIQEYMPDLVHNIYSGEEAQEKFRVSKDCVGAITYPAGQISPYKFVTQVVEMLVDNGVSLQTDTPVTSVIRNGDKWCVKTPRGEILASNVVHATNGYVAYLLPAFKTIIKPTRGHMTVQIPPKSLSEPPLDRTYSFIYEDGKFDYFIQQPAYDGCKLILGGGYYRDPQPTTANDAEEPEDSQQYLCNQLPKVFRWEGEEDPAKRLYMGWSGIMGFSEDGFPWVGPVSEEIGGGRGQWICAGYTGEGTQN